MEMSSSAFGKQVMNSSLPHLPKRKTVQTDYPAGPNTRLRNLVLQKILEKKKKNKNSWEAHTHTYTRRNDTRNSGRTTERQAANITDKG